MNTSSTISALVNIHEILASSAGMEISITLFRESNLKSYQSLVKEDLLNLLSILARTWQGTTHRIGQYCRLSFILIGSFYPSPTHPCFIFLCAYRRKSTLLASFLPDRRKAFNLWSWCPFVYSVKIPATPPATASENVNFPKLPPRGLNSMLREQRKNYRIFRNKYISTTLLF